MKRNEAVSYLKEVLNTCNDISPNSVSFEPGNSVADGYMVCIKGIIHHSDMQCVTDIAKKYSLEVQENANQVTIYKPKGNV